MASQDPTKLVVTAHATGISRLAFSPDGKYLYTSGAEGYVRIFDGRVDVENPFEIRLLEHHEEPITSLSATNDLLCSACESGEVAIHRSQHDGTGQVEFEALVTRTALPARIAKFNPKGTKIAVASDELIVKVVSVADNTDIELLTGHKKPVRDVVWSPDGQLLLTTDCDGSVRIWEFARSEPTCVHVMDDLVPANDAESEIPVSIVWHPSSKYFVVATKTHEIAVITRDDWVKSATYALDDGSGHTSIITSLACSSNGLYLASAGKEGKVVVWSTSSRKVVNQTTFSPKSLITGMGFHPAPGANILAYIDSSGQLTKWTAPIPLGKGLPFPGGPSAADIVRDDFDDELEGDWLDDDAGVFHAPAASQESRRQNFGVQDEAEEDDEADDEFDEDRLRLSKRKQMDPISKVREWENLGSGAGSTSVTSSKAQEAFQPGATPFKESKRYLAFNMLGFIHVVEREDHNIVTLEFHDRSTNPGSHFTDNFKYTLGSLGELGAVFACKSSGDEPSLIFYQPYDSWASTQEWQYKLPPSENVIALAVGGIAEHDNDDDLNISGTGTVVVATDRGYVRFFSGSGLQKYVWNLGEDVVTVVAGKDSAMVVWRAGGVLERRQNLEYTILDTDTFEVVQQGRLPLRKGAILKWVGFTDDHIPAMYDSDGTLSILDRARRPRQGRWVPALEMHSLARREGKQESYWPIGVSQKHVHAIILKGAERFPHFPTPIFQELELQFPLLRLDVAQGQLEEQYLRETLFVSHRRDGAAPDDYMLKTQLAREELETDKHLLKTIQTSCKAEKLQAALDATLMLTQPASIDAALKIAAFFRLPSLEERIEKVREAKTGVRALEDENKRKAKWSHLVDDRTILAPPSRRSDDAFNLFGGAPPSSRRAPPSSAYSRAPTSSLASKSQRMEKVDSGFHSDPQEADDSMDFGNDEQQYDVGEDSMDFGQEQGRSSSPAGNFDGGDLVEEPEEMPVPQPLKKALNPFSKREPAKTTTPAKANPFAAQKGTAKANDLHRTGSFFNRVEGKDAPTVKSRVSKASKAAPVVAPKLNVVKGTTQTTLFGLPPVDPSILEKKSKAGRKRKSDVTDVGDEGDDPAPPKEKKSKGSGSVEDGFRSRTHDGLGGLVRDLPQHEGDEMEETQQEDTQQDESYSTSLGAVEESLVEGEEEDTQVESQITAPPAQDGVSKLQQFKMSVAS